MELDLSAASIKGTIEAFLACSAQTTFKMKSLTGSSRLIVAARAAAAGVGKHEDQSLLMWKKEGKVEKCEQIPRG